MRNANSRLRFGRVMVVRSIGIGKEPKASRRERENTSTPDLQHRRIRIHQRESVRNHSAELLLA